MNSKKTIKKVLLVLLIAVVALVAYSFVAQKTNESQGNSSLSSLIGGSNVGQIKEQKSVLANAEILRILGSIQNISLDDDIFSNPVFFQLQDNNFRISSPNQVGRPNPFLPIGFDALFDSNILPDQGDQGGNEFINSGFFGNGSL